MKFRKLCASLALSVVWAGGAVATPAATAAPSPVPAPAVEAQPLPPGWSIESTPQGRVLVYTPAAPLPVRDARSEFRLGDALLGHPLQRNGRLELELKNGAIGGDPTGLSAWIGGSRIDQPQAPAARVAPTTVADPPPRPAPPGAVDPAKRGPYKTERLDYHLKAVAVAGLSIKSEVRAEVIAPKGAPGKRPVVLFLHGRHTTCYDPTNPEYFGLEWPCPDGTKPIPSFRGYRYVADILASQGYVTVSISANAINAYDGEQADAGMLARSEIVRHHLGLWAKWSRSATGPFGSRFVDKLDLSKVVLIGHSRGGEGVERAAIDAAAAGLPYTITGLGLIGPTDFGRQMAPNAHTAVILPYCDGDVSDLQGQGYVDDARDLLAGADDPALHSAVMVLGTNHNFYNTEWTPGQAVAPSIDDWDYSGAFDDPQCGASSPRRLSPVEQQAAGAAYLAALVRLAAGGDQAMLPYLDGGWISAPSAGRAVVYTHAIGGNHRLLMRADDNLPVTTERAGVRTCDGYQATFEPADVCVPDSFGKTPHWISPYSGYEFPSSRAVRIDWGDDGTARFALPQPVDLRSVTHVDARVAVLPGSDPAEMTVVFTDASGRRKALRPELRILPPLPGVASDPEGNPIFGPIPKVWAFTLRVDLSELPTSIRSSVASIGLFSDDDDAVSFLLDISTRRPTIGSPIGAALATVSVESKTVTEGDSGRTETLKLSIAGAVTKPATLWLSIVDWRVGNSSGKEVTILPGTTTIEVPIEIGGNTTFEGDTQSSVTVIARTNLTTSRYVGALVVKEDDPAPVVTITPVATDVIEGNPWTWNVDLDRPSGLPISMYIAFSPASDPALTLGDIDPQLRERLGFGAPEYDGFLLSSFPFEIFVLSIEPGTTSATFSIATYADGNAEATEYVRAQVEEFGFSTPPVESVLSLRDA